MAENQEALKVVILKPERGSIALPSDVSPRGKFQASEIKGWFEGAETVILLRGDSRGMTVPEYNTHSPPRVIYDRELAAYLHQSGRSGRTRNESLDSMWTEQIDGLRIRERDLRNENWRLREQLSAIDPTKERQIFEEQLARSDKIWKETSDERVAAAMAIVERVQEDHRTNLAKMEDNHKSAMEKVQEDHKSTLAKIEDNHKSALEKVREEKQEINSKFASVALELDKTKMQSKAQAQEIEILKARLDNERQMRQKAEESLQRQQCFGSESRLSLQSCDPNESSESLDSTRYREKADSNYRGMLLNLICADVVSGTRKSTLFKGAEIPRELQMMRLDRNAFCHPFGKVSDGNFSTITTEDVEFVLALASVNSELMEKATVLVDFLCKHVPSLKGKCIKGL
jgi:hypothetical protein